MLLLRLRLYASVLSVLTLVGCISSLPDQIPDDTPQQASAEKTPEPAPPEEEPAAPAPKYPVPCIRDSTVIPEDVYQARVILDTDLAELGTAKCGSDRRFCTVKVSIRYNTTSGHKTLRVIMDTDRDHLIFPASERHRSVVPVYCRQYYPPDGRWAWRSLPTVDPL